MEWFEQTWDILHLQEHNEGNISDWYFGNTNSGKVLDFVSKNALRVEGIKWKSGVWLCFLASSKKEISCHPDKLRIDPEVFLAEERSYIYYNRDTLETETTPRIAEGIYLVDTGPGLMLPP